VLGNRCLELGKFVSGDGSNMQAECCEAKDRHIPTFLLDNFLRRLVSPPKKRMSRFITTGSVVADLGCGPGHFTIPIAELVGSGGKVYAVDSDPRSIKALRAKTDGRDSEAVVEAHVASAANLDFIPDRSVDFAFANGLLCCMVDHAGAVAEIKRILKHDGLAYISITKVFRKKDQRNVSKEEWNRTLESFNVRGTGDGYTNRWAIISLKESPPQER